MVNPQFVSWNPVLTDTAGNAISPEAYLVKIYGNGGSFTFIVGPAEYIAYPLAAFYADPISAPGPFTLRVAARKSGVVGAESDPLSFDVIAPPSQVTGVVFV